MLNVRTFVLTALGVLALGACDTEPAAPEDETAPAVEPGEDADPASLAEAAVANPDRPEADREDDPLRQPAEVLAFTGIEPGMTVFEMEAGRGYYTEMKSYIAGPEGEVVMQYAPPFESFLGDDIAARLADNRLPNVRRSISNFDELDAADGSVDMVTWFLGPHEIYFTPTGSDGLGDVETTYAEIYRILKPGGTFVVLDHAAAPGSPETTGGTTHRIDPAIVKTLAEDAGFEFVAESDVLRNPDDDYDMSVFDPAIRRQTDRFLLKYKKPEEEGEREDAS